MALTEITIIVRRTSSRSEFCRSLGNIIAPRSYLKEEESSLLGDILKLTSEGAKAVKNHPEDLQNVKDEA